MDKRKKQFAILGALILAIILVVYFNFFNKTKPVTGPVSNIAGPAGLPGASSATVLPTSNYNPELQTGFLPDGAKLDSRLLDDPRLSSLDQPVYPTVTKSELYSSTDNPFLKPKVTK